MLKMEIVCTRRRCAMGGKCESCVYYSYDEEYDDYICEIDLDETRWSGSSPLGRTAAPIGDPETSTSPPGSNKNNTAPAKAGARIVFIARLNRILNVNDAQLGSVGSAHHNLYTFHTIYTAQGLH